MKRILIISFDLPVPANYGGAKDVYERIRYIKNTMPDAKIDMICMTLRGGATESQIIKDMGGLLDDVFIEKANIFRGFLHAILGLMPLSMAMRSVFRKDLFSRSEISRRDYDIVLVEHLKSWRGFDSIKKIIKYKKCYLRIHNIESEYYYKLFINSRPSINKIFYFMESILYRAIEKKIIFGSDFSACLYISKLDMKKIGDGRPTSVWLPYVMLPLEQRNIGSVTGIKRDGFLYVGSLDSPDNRNAIAMISDYIEKTGLRVRLTVAGKCTQSAALSLHGDFHVIKNPSDESLGGLYERSLVFWAFSNNDAGVKIKLIDALTKDIPIIVNDAGVVGSGFEDIIYNVDKHSLDDSRKHITRLIQDGEYWSDIVSSQWNAYRDYMDEGKNIYMRMFA